MKKLFWTTKKLNFFLKFVWLIPSLIYGLIHCSFKIGEIRKIMEVNRIRTKNICKLLDQRLVGQ